MKLSAYNTQPHCIGNLISGMYYFKAFPTSDHNSVHNTQKGSASNDVSNCASSGILPHHIGDHNWQWQGLAGCLEFSQSYRSDIRIWQMLVSYMAAQGLWQLCPQILKVGIL